MAQFTPRSEIPEVLIPGLVEYISYSGKNVGLNQKFYPTDQWNKFRSEIGTMPENKSGSNFILDTEFTDLRNGKLISAALVNFDKDPEEPENTFYIELTDAYCDDECSDFVKKEVLPYLKGDIYAQDTKTASWMLIQYLEKFPKPWRFWSDAPEMDNKQINRLIPRIAFVSESLRNINYMLATTYVTYSRKAEEFKDYHLHSALDDAKRYAVTWKKLLNALDSIHNAEELKP